MPYQGTFARPVTKQVYFAARNLLLYQISNVLCRDNNIFAVRKYLTNRRKTELAPLMVRTLLETFIE